MKKYRWNVKTFARNLAIGLSVVATLYLFACYVDIITHNLSGGTDAAWNVLIP